MKKQNNILSVIKNTIYLAFACMAFIACTDDDIYQASEIVEGVPVEIGFKFTVPSMQKVSTRGLTDEGEFQVNDLYVLIFDANNGQTRKDGGGYYNSEDIISATTGNQASGQVSTGKLTLKTTSGASLIYAVANVKGNDLGGDITTALEEVKSLADFKNLSVELTIKANVERSSPSLMMSGAYVDGTQPQTGYCNIPAESSTLKGKISLTRLDSHITFKLKPNMVANGGKIKTFTPKSWKVYNVPNKSYIVAQTKDVVSDSSADYDNTESSIRFGEQTDNIYDFDFYMLENRKNAIKEIDKYEQREKEIKNANQTNTGIYEYVEDYATFVEIKAHMEIENTKTDDGIRVADVTYVIHLGYVNNDPADFKNERNKKYTYNITINNVDDIVTEVVDNEHPENSPGAEGDVVDSQTTVFNLDAHYGYLILGFKYAEVKDGFQFYVKTPFGETNNEDSSAEGHDCKWLRFARCSENTLADYPENGKGLIDLFGLKADMEKQYENDRKENKIYYYTVFVDEYFYETNPLGNSKDSNWGDNNWDQFVNKDDRYALLIFNPRKSPDGESSYASAKYMITQKSIQTYYSTEKFNSNKTALGIEHIDETGVPAGWKSGDYGTNQDNGYLNTYSKVNGKSIRLYGNETEPNGKNVFTIESTANAIQACMARNRDENNDGTISGSEVKWFLPAINQLVGIFLGAESLPTPLFGDGDKQPKTYEYKDYDWTTKTGTYGTYHYISSDKQRLWSEEGATFGPAADILYAKAPEKLRCVRTLGISSKSQSANTSQKERGIYTYNSYKFQMNYLNNQSIRTSFIEKGELDIHHNFSPYNRPYSSFQVAQKRMTINGIKENWGSDPKPTEWKKLVKIDILSNSVCKNYYEKNDLSDKGFWRAPNQRELMIIYLENPSLVQYQDKDIYDLRYGSFTRTSWKFNEDDHFTVDKTLITKGTAGSFVRCVRDIK